ncbi:MAG: ATP-binding protein [candidate division KSB1 bacterium]|nr:ATP-binding protein [candidate division KSB1 bacterium]
MESISSNDVTCVLEDKNGALWIGTSHGLNKFDRKTQKFKHFIHDPNNPESISLDFVSCLYEDSRGDLWIGTGSITAETSGGINRFDRKTEKFISYKFEPGGAGYFNWITDIAEDASGNLWIGTDAGLHQYDLRTNTFTRHYYYHGRSTSSPAMHAIKSVLIDSKDNLWVGSYGGGLNRLDKATGEFIQYKNNPQDIHSLSNNKVLSIYEDRNGCLWMGTHGGGINTINPFRNSFRHYKKYFSGEETQSAYEVNNIRSIYEDRSGKLWLGSEGEINILDRSAAACTWATILSLETGSYVNSIIQDNAGVFWIGSAHGLIKYDPVKRQENSYTFNEPESSGKSALYVYTIEIDQEGILWLGTQRGLYRFDSRNESHTRIVHEPKLINTLSDDRVFSLLQNRAGILWVGTVYGLNKFDPGKQAFLNALVDAQILAHLRYNDIRVMCEDKSGNLWIGTAYGLKTFNQTTENLRLFTQKDGLPDNVINGLLPDDDGNIWISTNSGLSKLNPKTAEFKNYGYWDGIQNTTFNSGAGLKTRNGEMLFGGNNGLTAFYPDSIKRDVSEPPIVITGLKKFNEEVHLDTAISQIKQLVFSFDENVFAFEFAALNFLNPRKNQFAYKMEGFIDDWIYLGNKHDVNFTNLSPGKYVFRVKGSNHDGVWNEEGASIKVIITPPWWKTWWAYALYVTLLALTLYVLRLYDLRRQRLKHQLELEHVHAAKLEELDRVKSHFFANISHEFRTPLTLILGPLEKLIAEAREIDLKQQYQVMRRSGQRLLNLINQLLDISKLESGSMTLRASCQDVVGLLRRIVNSFISLAERKHITLAFKPAAETILAYVDRDKLEKIMNNLLANAFKFTPEGGAIEIVVNVMAERGRRRESDGEKGREGDWESGRIDASAPTHPLTHSPSRLQEERWVQITVKDTGIGIPTDKIDKVFDRFYQVDASQTRSYGGTGIGLALAKELVELHHGEISVASEKGVGTTFIVRLPLGKAHLQAEEIVEAPVSEKDLEEPPAEWQEILTTETVPEAQRPRRAKSAPILLVVEDNQDMRAYLCSLLSLRSIG